MEKKRSTVLLQKYELGRLLGQGTFAKVYYARNRESGQNVAVKVLDKEKVMKIGLMDQIKREISVMRLVKHPNVVQLNEVMASKSKIYFVIEFVSGGELFSKVAKGKLKEDAARRYFQQLVAAVDFCHSRGVYHRDLKPENLLVDEESRNLKVSDFGLSALAESRRQDGLLHTICGTPAYVAPEVINRRGYDGEKADIWSCGVILFVLLAGYLPFYDANLMSMYRKICKSEFKCPYWFPSEVKRLLPKILDPNPSRRITVAKLMENSWFRKGFKPTKIITTDPAASAGGSILEIFDANNYIEAPPEATSSSKPMLRSREEEEEERNRGGGGGRNSSVMKPTSMNAFDIISLSRGFNLSGLFENNNPGTDYHYKKSSEARLTTQVAPSMFVSKLEEVATLQESFRVETKDSMVKLQGKKEGRKGQLAIDAEIFEIAPSFHVIELKKKAGDTIEYMKFCDQDLRPSLKDICIWQGSS